MRAGEAQSPESRAVGAQLVGDQRLRCEALFLKQLAHELDGCAFIPSALNKHVENLALVVDGAPEIHPLAGDPDDHLASRAEESHPTRSQNCT